MIRVNYASTLPSAITESLVRAARWVAPCDDPELEFEEGYEVARFEIPALDAHALAAVRDHASGSYDVLTFLEGLDGDPEWFSLESVDVEDEARLVALAALAQKIALAHDHDPEEGEPAELIALSAAGITLRGRAYGRPIEGIIDDVRRAFSGAGDYSTREAEAYARAFYAMRDAG